MDCWSGPYQKPKRIQYVWLQTGLVRAESVVGEMTSRTHNNHLGTRFACVLPGPCCILEPEFQKCDAKFVVEISSTNRQPRARKRIRAFLKLPCALLCPCISMMQKKVLATITKILGSYSWDCIRKQFELFRSDFKWIRTIFGSCKTNNIT